MPEQQNIEFYAKLALCYLKLVCGFTNSTVVRMLVR